MCELRATNLRPRAIRPHPTCRGWWALEVAVDVPGLRRVRVLLCFPWHYPEGVQVFASGPEDSPHRFPEGHLCMWHPEDDESLRGSARRDLSHSWAM